MQLRQTCQRSAVGTLKTDLAQLAHGASGAIHAQLVDGGLEVGINKLSFAGNQRPVWATVCHRVIDVEQCGADRFGVSKEQAGEAARLNSAGEVFVPRCVGEGVGVVLGAGSAAIPILDACREDRSDYRRGRADIEHGDRIVFLQRDVSRFAIGSDRDRLGLHVLRDRGGNASLAGDADAAADQLDLAVVPGTEVDRLHIHLGRSRRSCQQIGRGVDHGDRTDRIDGVSRIGLTLIGDQQLLAVGTELHHVGQGAHGDGAEQGRKRGIGQVIELNRSRICFDGVLNRNCEQISEDRHALEGFTDDVGGSASHNHRAGRIA